ncbi:MAG TPA: MFS transporter, partial [Solirubrobacterales bacterium]|nr:MFS transporter [Solirubrobacterales bacterium]
GERGRFGVGIVAGAFFTMLMSANLATPLYAGYSERFGFSTAVLALIFATYAIVLIPSLLLFGQLSDRFGRRPVIAAGLVAAMAGLGCFALADSLPWLFAARALLGLAQGMVSGAATAALVELLPDGEGRRAALLATLGQAGGSASGPLFAGFLAHWAPAPHVVPFVLGLVVCALLIGLLAFVPETRRGEAEGWKIQRPHVPAEIRADFARVGITAAAAWAVAASLFLAVIPSYASAVLETSDLAVLGAVTATMLFASCAAQLALRDGAPPAIAQASGLILLAAGLLALVLATPLESPALLILGALLAGVGHGTAILAAQDNLTQIAPEEQRAEISAAFYVCVYTGVAGPVIGIGILAAAVSLYTAVSVFAAVTGVTALVVAGWHLRHREADERLGMGASPSR